MSEIEWNQVIYADCMNEENGLPTLPDKSIDLCLTDPPYNVDFKTQKRHKNPNWKQPNIILYEDKIDKEFNELWFKEIERICNSLIFTCGEKNISFWTNLKEPSGFLYNYKINGQGFTTIAKMNRTEIILCYGIKGQPFKKNTLKTYVHNGFLRDNGTFQSFIHPHPKPLELYNWIINSINPKSVIDPFLGSGTTAEVCTKLGIKWLGYEINEVYKQDIDKRLKNCKKESQQISLEDFNRI